MASPKVKAGRTSRWPGIDTSVDRDRPSYQLMVDPACQLQNFQRRVKGMPEFVVVFQRVQPSMELGSRGMWAVWLPNLSHCILYFTQPWTDGAGEYYGDNGVFQIWDLDELLCCVVRAHNARAPVYNLPLELKPDSINQVNHHNRLWPSFSRVPASAETVYTSFPTRKFMVIAWGQPSHRLTAMH